MVPDKYRIRRILAREVLDSRGNPTIEVDVYTGTCFGNAIVPSGASTGSHEALELRDGGKRYLGKGVLHAVRNVNMIIAPKLRGKDVRNQEEIDHIMLCLDGTENKAKLGANAILGVSMACTRAAANALGIPLYEYLRSCRLTKDYLLPVPFMNIINGGLHADNGLSFQEYMIVPLGKTFRESLRMAAETYHILKGVLHGKHGKGLGVGDEGGFSLRFKNDEEPVRLLVEATRKAGYSGRVKIAIDCAASDFYKNGRYHVNGKWHTPERLMQFYEHLLHRYPIVSIEDPFQEDDFVHFAELSRRNNVRVVGDDLLVTNPVRIQRAIYSHACNTLLLKVNQIGSVTDAVKAARLANSAGWKVMVSHRSGETEDAYIADLAVGLSTGMIKAGAPCRGERTAKYNRLLRIEEELGKKAHYSQWII